MAINNETLILSLEEALSASDIYPQGRYYYKVLLELLAR
jgi:hypothetical protein